MNKIKLIITLGVCGFTLAACGSNNSNSSENDKEATSSLETASSEVISEEPSLDDLDETTKNELNKSENEEIDWDNIHLNKRQYNEFVEMLSDTENGGEDEIAVTSSQLMDDNTIELAFNNPDTSEMSELTDQFFVIVMDTYLRQLYLHSDYSDGSTQPNIIIKDGENNVISESTDFIEMKGTE